MTNSWIFIKLGAVAKVIMGQAPLGSTYNMKSQGLPLIAGAGDLGTIYPNPIRWTTSPTQICQTGDLIFGVRATIGVMNWADKEYCLGRGVAAIRPNSDLIEGEYLYYCLIAHDTEILRFASGSTFIQIRRQDLEGISIPLPPLPEQRRIAAILREADEIHRLRQEANNKIRELYNVFFQDYFENDIANASEGDFVELENLLAESLASGFSPVAKDEKPGIPVLMLSAITNFGLDDSQVKYYPTENYHGKGSDLVVGDILITRSNTQELVGKAARYLGKPSPVIYPDLVIRIRLKNPEDSLYLESLLHSRSIQNIIQRTARGTSGSMKKISQGDINKFKIFWPSPEKRRGYTDLAEEINKQREFQKVSLSKLNTLRQSLLSQAFTGELTATWREQHKDELRQAARERDALLQRQIVVSSVPETPAPISLSELEPEREDLIDQLGPLQRALLEIFARNRRSYFTANQLYEDHEEELQAQKIQFSLDQTRRELRTLTALGLICEVALPVADQPGRIDYVTVYRYPQPEDNPIIEDLELLATRSL